MNKQPKLSNPDDTGWQRMLEERVLSDLRRKIHNGEELTEAETKYVELLRSYGRKL